MEHFKSLYFKFLLFYFDKLFERQKKIIAGRKDQTEHMYFKSVSFLNYIYVLVELY